MLVNYHFHSQCSFDGESPLIQLCAAAQAAGITHLCLTDHCDLVDEYGKDDDSWSWARIDEELQTAPMPVGRGIELGQAMLRPEAAAKALQEPGIDFVLGSMHHTGNREDFYYLRYTTRAQCLPLLEEYLQCLLALSRTDFFDSLAHLTYPLRYMRYRDGVDVDLTPFDDLVQEILTNLVHRGKALELNTSGYRTCGGNPMPPEDILRRYRALGGELITIGSDAHCPEHMASGLTQGLELLRHCGFRYLTLYQNRIPQQILL